LKDKQKEFKRNVVAVIAVLAGAACIGDLINYSWGCSKRNEEQTSGFFKNDADFIQIARYFFVNSANEGIIRYYQKKYPDDWIKKLKEDFKAQADIIYKSADSQYREKLKEDLIKEYKAKYGDRYREKIKADYKTEILGYYKKQYGPEYAEKLKGEVVSEYNKEFKDEYRNKLKEDLDTKTIN